MVTWWNDCCSFLCIFNPLLFLSVAWFYIDFLMLLSWHRAPTQQRFLTSKLLTRSHTVEHKIKMPRLSMSCHWVFHAKTQQQEYLHQSKSVWVSSGGWSRRLWRPASHTGCLCLPSSSPSGWSPELYLWRTVGGYRLKHNQIIVLAPLNKIVADTKLLCQRVDSWIVVFWTAH